MENLTKEQIDTLKEAEPYFRTVLDLQYKRATPNRLNNTVADLWETVSGQKVRRNWGCGVCCYDLYQQCGRHYFDSLKAIEESESVQGGPDKAVVTKKIQKTVTNKNKKK